MNCGITMNKIIQIIIINLLLYGTGLFAQQVNIPRVELMPDMPAPYQMRDWKNVAAGYDSMVFDFDLSGQYLPLVWINTSPINYPAHNSFGLHTAVGTYSPGNAEAINLLPAVIGASLIGIDKSNQNGYNWVLMCEEFFNRRPEENVYLNNSVTSSGSDWWYDTMPNIFFYQLYDLYPHTGDFDYQFTSVADQWLAAVVRMGGKHDIDLAEAVLLVVLEQASQKPLRHAVLFSGNFRVRRIMTCNKYKSRFRSLQLIP